MDSAACCQPGLTAARAQHRRAATSNFDGRGLAAMLPITGLFAGVATIRISLQDRSRDPSGLPLDSSAVTCRNQLPIAGAVRRLGKPYDRSGPRSVQSCELKKRHILGGLIARKMEHNHRTHCTLLGPMDVDDRSTYPFNIPSTRSIPSRKISGGVIRLTTRNPSAGKS